MCARWLKTPGFDPALLVSEVAKCAKADHDNVSFMGWQFLEIKSVLAERMDFHPDVAEADRPRVFWNALVNAAKTNRLTAEGLQNCTAVAETEYLKQAIQQFALSSTISLDRFEKLQDLTLDGCQLRYYAAPEAAPDSDRSPIQDRIDAMFRGRSLPTNYTAFTVHVRARTTTGAAEKALNAASLSRALINLWENQHIETRSFSGRPQPVNEVLPGPFSTLHLPDGKLASEEYWYEPSYIAPENPYRIRRPSQFHELRNELLLRLAHHPYAAVIKDALIRYNNALDKTDYDVAIIELWSVLELLTGIENARYEDLVKRASFLYSDGAWARALLNHLRHYRNRSVHSGRSSRHRDEAVHILRRFVQDLLIFHWHNRMDATSLAEACELLHLERDTATLERRIAMLKYAVRFLSSPEEADGQG